MCKILIILVQCVTNPPSYFHSKEIAGTMKKGDWKRKLEISKERKNNKRTWIN